MLAAGRRVWADIFAGMTDRRRHVVISLVILIFQKDLGSSLLFFGLFVAMLYVATERTSWIALGLILAAGGAYLAYLSFGHVQTRVLLWLDTFSPEAVAASDQLAKGLMGMASGGLLGTGLGRGRPDITYFAESDFIFSSFGEELGLMGLFAILVLYGLLVERGCARRSGAGRVRETHRRRALLWGRVAVLRCRRRGDPGDPADRFDDALPLLWGLEPVGQLDLGGAPASGQRSGPPPHRRRG